MPLINTWVSDVEKHDGEICNFFPYADNREYWVQCYLVVQPYNFHNRKDVQLVNVKLFSINTIDTFVVDLQNLYKLEFTDSQYLPLNKSIIPLQNELYSNNVKTSSSKIGQNVITAVKQFGFWEFNIVNEVLLQDADLHIIVEENGAAISGWKDGVEFKLAGYKAIKKAMNISQFDKGSFVTREMKDAMNISQHNKGSSATEEIV